MLSTSAHPKQMETTPQRSFTRTVLPWAVAAIMLLVYMVTLHKVVTVPGVLQLAKVTGVDWHATYTQPLYWLVTLPVRILPAGIQLIGMNFIAALCAAFSLALLARSVALLPHDRTPFQRDRLSSEDSFLNIRLAWVPVVFAVLVCGLQRTFWEHAIVHTGEAFDLLLFAYCVRCLLEYRVDERNAWLYKLAVVYGAAITNNFAMIAFFPALLVSLIWMKGLRFFRFDFLVRMFLLGLAGLSFYLLLPLMAVQSDVEQVTFWQALKANLSFQKNYLMNFPRWRIAILIAPYALVPLLVAGIRWPNSFGDSSAVGSMFANIFAYLLHAGLLVFALYMAFDPPGAGLREFGLGLAYLPCYFLAALSIGYFTGFLLLVFGGAKVRSRRHRGTPAALNYAITGLVCVGVLAVVGALLVRNYPLIRDSASRSLHDYAEAQSKSLPEKGSVVLSDDPIRLYALAATLGSDRAKNHILLDTTALTTPQYHNALRERYGDRWPKLTVEPGYIGYAPQQIVQALVNLSKQQELIYLQPSFGYYFETFYLEPRGTVYAMRPYPGDSLVPPAPTPALIAQQDATWNALAGGSWKDLKSRLAEVRGEDHNEAVGTASAFIGACYSRALNWWGVELHRAERFDEAAKYFKEALAMNPHNVSALINTDVNTLWRDGKKRLEKLSPEIEQKLQIYKGVNSLVGVCGPVDLPEFAMEIGNFFVKAAHYKQAAQMVHRALAFAPENLIYQTALANTEALAGRPEVALRMVSEIRPKAANAEPGLQVELDRIQAFAHYSQANFPAAERILESTVKKFPKEDASYNVLSQLYVLHSQNLAATNDPTAGRYLTNALRVIERQVQQQPENLSARFNHGNLLMLVGDYLGAANEFSEVLKRQKNNDAALLNRAISYLQGKKLDEANRDYQELLDRYTTTDFRVYYGLGEIAYQKQNWREAREHFTEYLRHAPANSGESAGIRQRLEELKKKS